MATTLNKTQAISNLQRYLRRISLESADRSATTVPIDGVFDTATRDALTQFQAEAGLPATGIADKQTWDALFEEYMRVTEAERTAQGLFPFPKSPRGYAVSRGDTATLVRIIQLLLIELSVTYDALEQVLESGTYDIRTENAVREFQKINGLSATGDVDEITWNRLVKEYSNLSKRETS